MRFEVTQPLCFGINQKVEIAFAATVRPQRVRACGGVACTRRSGACLPDEVTGGNGAARRLNTVPAKFTTANLFKWLIVNQQLFNKAELQLFTKKKTPQNNSNRLNIIARCIGPQLCSVPIGCYSSKCFCVNRCQLSVYSLLKSRVSLQRADLLVLFWEQGVLLD